MVKYWSIKIPELTGDKERLAYIYLPESYESEPERRYPVLYMFDGHNLFFNEHATYGKSWGLKEYMDRTKTPVIIAAVECNHDADNGRLKEYAPYSFSDPVFGEIEGKGHLTMEWIVNVFKPYIDSNFRTLKERRNTMIAGSSMGGLMSLYAVLQYNYIFSRAAALSPSIWCTPKKIEKLIRSAKIKPGTVVYMDYGTKEFKNHSDIIREFGQTSALMMRKRIAVESRIVLNGTHSEESWEKQIPFFMNTLLYDL